jgi:hypothetical protein
VQPQRAPFGPEIAREPVLRVDLRRQRGDTVGDASSSFLAISANCWAGWTRNGSMSRSALSGPAWIASPRSRL